MRCDGGNRVGERDGSLVHLRTRRQGHSQGAALAELALSWQGGSRALSTQHLQPTGVAREGGLSAGWVRGGGWFTPLCSPQIGWHGLQPSTTTLDDGDGCGMNTPMRGLFLPLGAGTTLGTPKPAGGPQGLSAQRTKALAASGLDAPSSIQRGLRDMSSDHCSRHQPGATAGSSSGLGLGAAAPTWSCRSTMNGFWWGG